MFPNYVSHYFFISQSVPNLLFSYPSPVNSNNYQYSYYTAPYQSPFKSRYQYHDIPRLGKSKSSAYSIHSQEKLIKSKSRNISEENLLNNKSSESLLDKSYSFDNYSTKTRCSETKTKKKLRFIDTYRDKNYQKELGNDKHSDASKQRRKRNKEVANVVPVSNKNDVNNSHDKLYKIISDKNGLILLKEVV